MLIDFSISNFRSFNDTQTLSMVASPRQPDHPEHLTKIPASSEKLLPLALIYGANGAGKSNLIKGLAFMRRLVVIGTDKDAERIEREAFRLGANDASKPTECEVRFVAGQESRVFTYGFRVTDTEVVAEWLSVLDGETEVDLFERVTEAGKVIIEAGEALKDGKHHKELTLAELGVRPMQLYLAAMRESIARLEQGPLIREVRAWFDSLSIVRPTTRYGLLTKRIEKDQPFAEFVGRFLHDLGADIREVCVRQVTPPKDVSEGLREPLDDHAYRERLGDGDMIVERSADGGVSFRSLQTAHRAADGRTEYFSFRDESDGTQRLTHLLPVLFDHPKIHAIDELERSLHPLLAKKFIEFFLRTQAGNKCQLIVTTHASTLLDLDILRRDEVWFTEKDDKGATALYSLADFKVRTDMNIEKGYLQGQFEAIPFLGDLDAFVEKLHRSP